MGYAGQTYRVPCDVGGWNFNPNTDLIKPESMVDCININLHRGGRETRGGILEVNSTPITNSVQIMGLFQFKKQSGSSYIVTGTTDGKIQKDYATVLKSTGLTAGKYFNFAAFKDNLYICNGYNVPQIWNGAAATTSDMTLIPADWTSNNFPKAMLKHGRGASERLWAYGCPSNPKTIYVSENGSADFTDAKVIKINIETGDGAGVVGMVEYGDRAIALGKTKPYLINDTELDTANWGYDDGQWEGGVAHERLIVKTPNDVMAMSEDGEIYSIITTQTYGDYVANSITRPNYIDRWIRDNIDLSKIAQFHGVYDPTLRAVKYFMVRKGQTQIDTVLVYFIDKGPEAGWVKHQYADTYFASCSAGVTVSTGIEKVYAGGYVGHVYQLDYSTATDDGLYFYSSFMIPELNFDNPRTQKRYDKGWMVIKPQGTETIRANLIVDGVYISGGALLIDENGNSIGDESGNVLTGGSVLEWSVTATEASDKLSNLGFNIGIIGKRIQAEFFNNTIGQKFFVSQILFDFVPLQANVS